MCEDIVERLRGVDHMSVEDCFLQSPLFEKAADEIERLRAWDEQHYRSAKQTWQAIPDEFKLSPTDGGGIDEHFAIADMAKEIERLRANLTEALRLMGPVACPVDGDDPVLVNDDDARAIAAFVERMKGGGNE